MTGIRNRRMLVAVLAATLSAATLLAAGCGSPYGLSESERMDRQAELAARPTIDQAVARYDRMQQQIRDRLDSEIGPFAWFQVRQGDEGACEGDFPDVYGRSVALAPWGFDANLPDADWPTARSIITEITLEYGFDAPGMSIDTPGRHRMTGIDTTLGANYEFGTQVNSTMQVVTGCHPMATGL